MSSTDLTATMIELADVWYAETAVVKIEHNEDEWCVALVWTSEYDNPHGADWCEYTWQFYGDSAYGAAPRRLQSVRACPCSPIMVTKQTAEEVDGDAQAQRLPH